MPVAGAELGEVGVAVVRELCWIHWDDVGAEVGRLLRLEDEYVVYCLPMDSGGRMCWVTTAANPCATNP